MDRWEANQKLRGKNINVTLLFVVDQYLASLSQHNPNQHMASDKEEPFVSNFDWDFNCPKFVDFEKGIDDDNADAWFETEEAFRSLYKSPSRAVPIIDPSDSLLLSPINAKSGLYSANTTPNYASAKKSSISRSSSSTKRNAKSSLNSSTLSNCSTSSSRGTKRKASNTSYTAASKQKAKRTKQHSINPNDSQSSMTSTSTCASYNEAHNDSQTQFEINTTQLKHSISKWVPKLTKPRSPKFASSRRPRAVSAGHEDTKVREAMRKRIQEKKDRQQKMQAALKASLAFAAKSDKPLTQPLEFSFRTEQRARRLHNLSSASANGSMNSSANTSKRDTSTSSIHSPFEKSLVQKVNEFYNRIPDRFKAKPAPRPPVKPLNLTTIQEFSLSTSRINTSRNQSTQEMEEMELKRLPKWKARPLNPKILHSAGDLGVPRVEKKPLTTFQEFSLRTDSRGLRRKRDNSMNSSVGGYESDTTSNRLRSRKMRRLNSSAMSANTSTSSASSSRSELRRTVPATPLLRTKQRAQLKPVPPMKVEEPVIASFKAKPMPQFEPFIPKTSNAPLTAPRPFDLHTEMRGEEYKREFEQRLKEAEERIKKARQFKAHPIAEFETQFPPVRKLPLTQPDPFPLESVTRHDVAIAKWKEQLEEEERRRKEAMKFKAHPMPDLSKPNFVPHRSTKPLTEITDFELNTERRTLQRKEFEMKLALKEQQLEEAKKQKAVEEEEKAKEEIQELRKKLMFKARPVPSFYGNVSDISNTSSNSSLNGSFGERRKFQPAISNELAIKVNTAASSVKRMR